jgi:hypothetical protein
MDMSDSSSRYSNCRILTYKNNSDHDILYRERRFVPKLQPLDFGQITIEPYERLDNVSARVIGDPLQYWRICDNTIIYSPLELTNKSEIVNVNTSKQ